MTHTVVSGRIASWPTARVDGQKSYLLNARSIELALTATGGMLGPVTFFPHRGKSIRPYAVAPWAQEPLPPGTSPMIQALRGDWFCSAFGGNHRPYRGRKLPPHGETANRQWKAITGRKSGAGTWLRTRVEMPLQGGSCEATTAILNDQTVIYQRHELRGLNGPTSPGHHATLAFPNVEGVGRLSFSRLVYAHTYIEPTERAENRGYSILKPDVEITDLRAVPCVDGSTTDLTRYPARRGYEDIVILCADTTLEWSWSAVTFADQGYVWFALRDPELLSSTVLWFSNGGRHYPPWNGRHVNVLGMEDVTAFFHAGLAESCETNHLTKRGIRTCLEPSSEGRLSIPYIQGVARIPTGFDCVARIESFEPDRILLRAESGVTVESCCHIDFLRTGTLPDLDLPE